MILRNIIIAFSILFVFTSCEDYLTETIEFEELGFEPQIVINAKVRDTLDFLQISVSPNINLADGASSDFTFINGATVKVFIDGEEFEAIEDIDADPNVESYNYRLELGENFDLSDKVYELEVSHPDYTTVRSNTFVGQFPMINDISFEEEARTTTFFGYPLVQDATTFTIVDEDEGPNFYKIDMNTDGFFSFVETDDADAINLGGFEGTVLLSDENFVNGVKQITVFSENNPWQEAIDRSLIVSNISESEYLFLQSFELYQQSTDFGFFSEPVTLYTNIENGLGVFSAIQSESFPVE